MDIIGKINALPLYVKIGVPVIGFLFIVIIIVAISSAVTDPTVAAPADPGTSTAATPAVTASAPAPPKYGSQVVYGNNGAVSCTTYCGGTEGKPWNNELPVDWNGAACSETDNPDVLCDDKPSGPIKCTCRPTGAGWNQ